MVYVDLVGRTDRRWISHQDGIPANLANTGLNAMTHRGILHLNMTAMPHMNVAERVGAFGWIFADRHTGELIAFRQLSTEVTGFLNAENTRFNAGGTSFSGNFTTTQGAIALFSNGSYSETVGGGAAPHIREIAGGAYAPQNCTMNADGRQVTMHVDISGQTITRIYSVNGWAADSARVTTAAEVNMIASDGELLGGSFPLNHDQVIDYRMFQLIGANCLRDIEAGDVVYVYTDDDDVITRVAVGTEVVEGLMTEASDTRFVVDGTSYNYARRYLTSRTRTEATLYSEVYPHAGSDVRVLLDAYGNAFRIEIVGAETGNFGIVIAHDADPARGNVLRLFTNDDADETFNVVGRNLSFFQARPFTGGADRRISTDNSREFPNHVMDGALVGFGLNAAGSINALENAVGSGTLTHRPPGAAGVGNDAPSVAVTIDVRSRTVVRVDGRDVTLDRNAPVFYLDTSVSPAEWNVASVADIDLAWFRNNAAPTGQYILNISGNRVIALTLPMAAVDADAEAVFGMINSVMNIAGPARNLTGFFDGARTASTIRTANDFLAGEVDRTLVQFFNMTPNAAGQIRLMTDIVHQTPVPAPADDRFVSRAASFPAFVTESAMSRGVQMLDRDFIDASNLFIELANNQRITLADDVVIYRATVSGGNIVYSLSGAGLSAIRGEAWVWAFNTESDITSEANVVIWMHPDDYPW